MAAVIRRFRMAIVQTATMLELLRHEPSSLTGTLRQLARSTGYQQLFRRVGASGAIDEQFGVSVPWNVPPEEQPFWSYYLKHPSIREVKENLAWKSAVPLRRRLSDRLLDGVAADAVGGSAARIRDTAVAYYYPHGLGLIVDIDVAGQFAVDGFVDAARRLRGSDPLDGGGQLLETNAFVRKRLSALASELAGSPLDSDSLGPQCTVVSVIIGEADPEATATDPALRKALLALADWRAHWRHHTVADDEWTAAIVRVEGEPSAQVVLAAGRGRVAWYPLDFLAPVDAARRKTKLRELHAELMLSALQVESLAQLVLRSLPQQQWTSLQDNRVRTAVTMLRALFHRARDLPSHSPRRHILDNGYASKLNQAEQRLGRPPSFTPS